MKFPGLAGSALALVFVSATAAAAYPATSNVAANVRSGPGASYKVVGHLAADTPVEAGSCRGGWCQVGSGWVAQSLLTAEATASEPASSYYTYNDPYYAYNDPYDYYYDYYDDPFDDGPFFFGFRHHGFHDHHGDHGHFPGHGGPGHAYGGRPPILTGRASAVGPAPGMMGGGGFGHGGGGFGGHGGGGFGGGGGGFHGGGGGGHR